VQASEERFLFVGHGGDGTGLGKGARKLVLAVPPSLLSVILGPWQCLPASVTIPQYLEAVGRAR
jgi:hypothetical protein